MSSWALRFSVLARDAGNRVWHHEPRAAGITSGGGVLGSGAGAGAGAAGSVGRRGRRGRWSGSSVGAGAGSPSAAWATGVSRSPSAVRPATARVRPADRRLWPRPVRIIRHMMTEAGEPRQICPLYGRGRMRAWAKRSARCCRWRSRSRRPPSRSSRRSCSCSPLGRGPRARRSSAAGSSASPRPPRPSPCWRPSSTRPGTPPRGSRGRGSCSAAPFSCWGVRQWVQRRKPKPTPAWMQLDQLRDSPQGLPAGHRARVRQPEDPAAVRRRWPGHRRGRARRW